MFKPENESNNDVERKVKEVITKELGLPEMTNNIDKLTSSWTREDDKWKKIAKRYRKVQDTSCSLCCLGTKEKGETC